VIKDAAPLEARFTILEENKSCQQIIIHFKEHGDCSFSETFVCAQIWKHRADEHLTKQAARLPGQEHESSTRSVQVENSSMQTL
jgi:hypothetical protein